MAQEINPPTEYPGYPACFTAVGVDNSLLFPWVTCKEVFAWNMAGGWVYDGKYKIGYESSWLNCRSYIPFNWERPTIAISARRGVDLNEVQTILDWISNKFKVSPFNVKIRTQPKYASGSPVIQIDMDEKWFCSPVSMSLVMTIIRMATTQANTDYNDGYTSTFDRITGPIDGKLMYGTYRSADLSYLLIAAENGNLPKLVSWTLKAVTNPCDWKISSSYSHKYLRGRGFADYHSESDGPILSDESALSTYGRNPERPAY